MEKLSYTVLIVGECDDCGTYHSASAGSKEILDMMLRSGWPCGECGGHVPLRRKIIADQLPEE